MKVETGIFTPNSTNVAIILADDTLQVQNVSFLVTHATSTQQGASAGTSNGTNNYSQSVLKYTSEVTYGTDDFSITHYKRVSSSNVRKLAGVVTDLSEPGMIYMTFTNYDPTLTVRYVATGV